MAGFSQRHGARQALAEYMYKVSHDLNEPLRMVASYCGLLERRYADALDEDARAFIGFAQDGAVRMQSLLSDLLQLSRVNTHRKPPAPVASGLCLRAAMTLLRDRIAETGAEVSCGDMPVVQADEAQLVEVFRQLLNNALKFRVESEAPRLRLSADSADGTWRFRIADNGIGVPPEQARRIFEVFQRLHGRDAYSGNGIGLTLCRAILERHGGFISMASEVGVGTSVHCDLPAERVFEVRGEERDLISSFRQIARSQGS
jgi:light-regulated signal transduction histidine kinase (bacteriophytochrome)